jgi:FSR family fosmidomycin resistance protein-like MFS transporter
MSNACAADATPLSTRRVMGVSACLGLMHAVVDAACLALLFELAGKTGLASGRVWPMFFLYNAIAFGGQFALGTIADRRRLYQATAFTGLGTLAAAVLLAYVDLHAAIVVAAFGNAAFHVGAGAIVLSIYPDKASAEGVFVAPGGLGVAVGAFCGGVFPVIWRLPALVLLVVSGMGLCLLRDAGARGTRLRPSAVSVTKAVLMLAVVALLFSIAVRSAVGMTMRAIWQGETEVLWALAVAAFCGKFLGGLLADRFGWVLVSITAIVLSTPLLAYETGGVAPAVVGTALFTMTMPVTLLALYRAFPDEPGLTFGLTTLALLIGASPVLMLPNAWFTGGYVVAALGVLSAMALLLGLPPLLRAAPVQQSQLDA